MTQFIEPQRNEQLKRGKIGEVMIVL